MLRFDSICKTFHPGTPDAAVVFQNFNLELQKGEFLSIVGSNEQRKNHAAQHSLRKRRGG